MWSRQGKVGRNAKFLGKGHRHREGQAKELITQHVALARFYQLVAWPPGTLCWEGFQSFNWAHWTVGHDWLGASLILYGISDDITESWRKGVKIRSEESRKHLSTVLCQHHWPVALYPMPPVNFRTHFSQSVLWRPLALFAADRCMCFLQPRAETTGEGRKRRTRVGH